MDGIARELTFGEKMVGLDFNPSGDSAVITTKKYYAQIIDDMDSLRSGNVTAMAKGFYGDAIEYAVMGCMLAVKAITCKY